VRRAVAELLESQTVLPAGQLALALPGEAPVYCRAALSALGGRRCALHAAELPSVPGRCCARCARCARRPSPMRLRAPADAPKLREALLQAVAQGLAASPAQAQALAAELDKLGASPGKKGPAAEQYARDMDRHVITAMQVRGNGPAAEAAHPASRAWYRASCTHRALQPC
jgi:hypothetical protein